MPFAFSALVAAKSKNHAFVHWVTVGSDMMGQISKRLHCFVMSIKFTCVLPPRRPLSASGESFSKSKTVGLTLIVSF